MNKEKIKNDIITHLKDEFPKYTFAQITTRNNLIKENIIYKTKFENIPKNNNKYKFKKSKIIYNLPEPKSFNQNFFCYPIDKNFLSKSEYTLNYLEPFSSFEIFDKTLTKSFQKLSSFYHFFPQTLGDRETIDNKYFFIWVFINLIIQIDNENQKIISINKNIENKKKTINLNDSDVIIDIIEIFSKILNKEFKYFYRVISQFIMTITKKLNIENCINKPMSILQYRKSYCPLCFKYLCRQHFYESFQEFQSEDMNGIIYIKSQLKKISGERNFFIKKDDEKIEKNFICPDNIPNNKCKQKYKVSLYKSNGIEENHIEIINLMSKNDFYILNCLLSTKSFNNSCFFAKLFNYKYPCTTIEKIILISQDERNIREIDNYLTYEKMGGIILPKISMEKMEIVNIKKDKNQNKNYKNETSNITINEKHKKNYIPCDHFGSCKKENCSCLKERGFCEKFCVCSSSKCEYLFEGCECNDSCDKISQNTSTNKCKCIKEGRECDPDICKNCKNMNLCQNMKIYYKKYKKTKMGQSLIIPGAGLFAEEDIKANELINEYIGEMVEKDELERRSIINMAFERNYGFELTEEFDIDATRFGNLLRYVNHSSYGYENCYAREKFVRGDIKIVIFAKRNIKKGEELYFDYHMKNSPWVLKYNKLYGGKVK